MDQLVLPLPVQFPSFSHPTREKLDTPRLSIVIVNYNQWGLTSDLVQQITRSPRLLHNEVEVIVVDNHSGFHPQRESLRSAPGVSVVRWRRNRGFARAVNEGCRLGKGDWLLLLNPDMSLDTNFLDRVLRHLDQLEEEPAQPGIVGFGLANSDGSEQKSTGPFPTLLGTLLRRALPRWIRKYHLGEVPSGTKVDWVSGCCLMVRRACWEDVGGFDPAFFLYYEDVDLCKRAHSNGWEVIYQPGPKAVHHHPLHSRRVPAHIRLVTRHALLTYAEKHWPAWQFRILARIVKVEALWTRFWSWCRQDRYRTRISTELEGVVEDLVNGQPCRASQRLLRVVWSEEKQRGQTLPHHP